MGDFTTALYVGGLWVFLYFLLALAMCLDFPHLNSSSHPELHDKLQILGLFLSGALAMLFVSHFVR